MELKNPDIRYLYDMKEVLYDREWLKKSENFEVYYMYRELERKGNLRYDITVIPPKMLGTEFTKTKGHYHPDGFGELYIVLSGKAFYLIQKISEKDEVEDVFAVEAGKGECVVVPPQYGHITINHGEETLKMANWVCDFDSSYSLMEKRGGGAYYLTKGGWIRNKNYEKVPELRIKAPEKEMPEDLSFLGC